MTSNSSGAGGPFFLIPANGTLASFHFLFCSGKVCLCPRRKAAKDYSRKPLFRCTEIPVPNEPGENGAQLKPRQIILSQVINWQFYLFIFLILAGRDIDKCGFERFVINADYTTLPTLKHLFSGQELSSSRENVNRLLTQSIYNGRDGVVYLFDSGASSLAGRPSLIRALRIGGAGRSLALARLPRREALPAAPSPSFAYRHYLVYHFLRRLKRVSLVVSKHLRCFRRIGRLIIFT